MKVRNGFVTNSSSSSFVIRRCRENKLLEELVINYKDVYPLLDLGDKYGYDNFGYSAWDIDVSDEYITCNTPMDNFDLRSFAEDLGLSRFII